MRAVDDVILALLRETLPPIDNPLIEGTALDPRVHDGDVVVANETNVLRYATPYVVYASNNASPEIDTTRLSGRTPRRAVFFSLKVVGESRAQVKWAVEKLDLVLERRRLDFPGLTKPGLVMKLSSTRVFRDDDAIRPDGTPLFYCEESYSVDVQKTQFPIPA